MIYETYYYICVCISYSTRPSLQSISMSSSTVMLPGIRHNPSASRQLAFSQASESDTNAGTRPATSTAGGANWLGKIFEAEDKLRVSDKIGRIGKIVFVALSTIGLVQGHSDLFRPRRYSWRWAQVVRQTRPSSWFLTASLAHPDRNFVSFVPLFLWTYGRGPANGFNAV